MQDQRTITRQSITRPSLASLTDACHSTYVLGVRGPGDSSLSCALTGSPPQSPVTRGSDVNSNTDKDEGSAIVREVHAGVSIDSPACSLHTKNSPLSNPCWSAHEPCWRALNPTVRLTSGTWCSSGQARILIGKQVYFWCANCATMAASAALCSGPTGAAAGRRGTRTAYRRCCGSVEPRMGPRKGQSITPATLHGVLDVLEGIRPRNGTGVAPAGSEYYVNFRALEAPRGQHNIRYRRRGRPPPNTFVVLHRCSSLDGANSDKAAM